MPTTAQQTWTAPLCRAHRLHRPTLTSACCAMIGAMTILAPAAAAVPRYDHILIVVMENHGLGQIVDNPAAPYITSLAHQGANFVNAHGVGHPSQPNYLALFSGSTQGITDDSCPHTYTGVNNLATQLSAAGLRFAGYSESMPSAGYAGCQAGAYVRKHNPWVNFANVASASNLPYSAFPTDLARLPTVTFLVPNLANDMHNGSVKAGDTWLKNNIDAYARWATTHNSLLILTFDEADALSADNRVPTIMVGAGIVPGTYREPIDHYSVLATVDKLCGLPALTAAAPIVDVFAAAP